jgi:hypothetical protein
VNHRCLCWNTFLHNTMNKLNSSDTPCDRISDHRPIKYLWNASVLQRVNISYLVFLSAYRQTGHSHFDAVFISETQTSPVSTPTLYSKIFIFSMYVRPYFAVTKIYQYIVRGKRLPVLGPVLPSCCTSHTQNYPIDCDDVYM